LYKIPARTLFLGKNLIFVPECHSTNSLALQLAQQTSTPEGTLVITDCQTAGRGQRGNTWETEPGMNLTFSILVKPSFLSPIDQFFLNIAVSIGIVDYLKSVVRHDVRIKWPNDILIDEKKVCGILIENTLQGAIISSSIIGIGLNINQTQFSSPKATSVKLFSEVDLDLSTALEELVSAIEKRYLQLRQGERQALTTIYYENMFWKGEEREFRSAGIEFTGSITGIDGIGRLKVHTENGDRVFALKEIELLY
jgi:BirA family biotin operon repressor/biotin-[acetyl-CoA-carboxylase] ligase